MTNDSIETLLADKVHPLAQKLLEFHRLNLNFIPRFVAEFGLLKLSGQKSGSANAIFHFVRWTGDWRGVDEFKIANDLAALVGRVCSLLWPKICNGMMQFRYCPSNDVDAILRARLVHREKRYGTFIYPCRGIEVDRSCLPDVPLLERPQTLHNLISYADAAGVIPSFEKIVADSPKPNAHVLQSLLRHVKEQPEIFALVERTLLKRQPECFSATSLLHYGRWSIRRAAAEGSKRFTLPSMFEGLYSRVLILRNPDYNGRCAFREDSAGARMHGRSNKLLGVSIATTPVNGEPYRRLLLQSVEHCLKKPVAAVGTGKRTTRASVSR